MGTVMFYSVKSLREHETRVHGYIAEAEAKGDKQDAESWRLLLQASVLAPNAIND